MPHQKKWLSPAILSGMAITAFMLSISSRYGLAVTQDSVSYLSAAQSIRQGLGPSMQLGDGSYSLITHWPPMYSMTLAAAAWISGTDPLSAGRWLGAFLAGLAVGIAILLFASLNVSRRATAALTVLLVVSPVWHEFFYLRSESLFVPLVLMVSFAVSRFLADGKTGWLILAALAVGLSMVTRYAGAGFFLATAGFLLVRRVPVPERLFSVSVYAGVGSLFPLIWVAYAARYGADSTRSLVFHPLTGDDLRTLAGTLLHWISPYKRFFTSPFLMLLLLWIGISAWKNGARPFRCGSESERYLSGMALIYVLFIAVSISFFDFSTTLDGRILGSAWPLLLVAGHAFFRNTSTPRVYVFTVSLMLTSCVVYLCGAAADFHKNGWRYTGTTWRTSEVIAWVKEDDPEKVVFSNGDYAIRFLASRYESIYPLPRKYSSHTTLRNPDFEMEMERMRSVVMSGHGRIVFFDNIFRPFYPGPEELLNQFPDGEVMARKDGFILLYPP